MANTFLRSGNVLTVTLDGSTDWVSSSESAPAGLFANGMFLESIQWYLAAAGTNVIVRNISNAGAIIVKATDVAGGGQAMNLGGKTKYYPVIKGTEMHSGDLVNFHFKVSEDSHEL
jgi:hypothetical protein